MICKVIGKQKLSRSLLAHFAQALLQFEDFNLEHAQPLLERYRYHHLVFNDDIQARQGPAPPGSDPEVCLACQNTNPTYKFHHLVFKDDIQACQRPCSISFRP